MVQVAPRSKIWRRLSLHKHKTRPLTRSRELANEGVFFKVHSSLLAGDGDLNCRRLALTWRACWSSLKWVFSPRCEWNTGWLTGWLVCLVSTHTRIERLHFWLIILSNLLRRSTTIGKSKSYVVLILFFFLIIIISRTRIPTSFFLISVLFSLPLYNTFFSQSDIPHSFPSFLPLFLPSYLPSFHPSLLLPCTCPYLRLIRRDPLVDRVRFSLKIPLDHQSRLVVIREVVLAV